MVSEAQKRATKKYNEKNYDTVAVRVEKGKKPMYIEYASEHGMSLAGLVQTAVDKYIEENK